MCNRTEIWTLAIQHEVFTALLQKQAEAQAWLQTGVTTCGPFQVPYQTSLHPSLPGVPGNRLWDRSACERSAGRVFSGPALWGGEEGRVGWREKLIYCGKESEASEHSEAPRGAQVETKELLWVKLCSYQEDEDPDSQDLEWMWTYLEKGSLCSSSWGHRVGPHPLGLCPYKRRSIQMEGADWAEDSSLPWVKAWLAWCGNKQPGAGVAKGEWVWWAGVVRDEGRKLTVKEGWICRWGEDLIVTLLEREQNKDAISVLMESLWLYVGERWWGQEGNIRDTGETMMTQTMGDGAQTRVFLVSWNWNDPGVHQ